MSCVFSVLLLWAHVFFCSNTHTQSTFINLKLAHMEMDGEWINFIWYVICASREHWPYTIEFDLLSTIFFFFVVVVVCQKYTVTKEEKSFVKWIFGHILSSDGGSLFSLFRNSARSSMQILILRNENTGRPSDFRQNTLKYWQKNDRFRLSRVVEVCPPSKWKWKITNYLCPVWMIVERFVLFFFFLDRLIDIFP